MQALLRQGKHAKALGETRSLTVEGDPAAAEVLMVQAEALYGSGNLEKAIKMYEEVCLGLFTTRCFDTYGCSFVIGRVDSQ